MTDTDDRAGDQADGDEADGAPDRAGRRRLMIKATVRAVVTTGVLVALYYVLPLDADRFGVSIVLRLTLGILVFVALMAFSVRNIVESDNPGLKAFESLFVAVPLFLLLFSATYLLISRADASNFSEPLTRTDALYFTVTVFSTVGFGDISPKTEPARLLVSGQMILDLVVLGLGVRVIAEAVQRGRDRLGG